MRRAHHDPAVLVAQPPSPTQRRAQASFIKEVELSPQIMHCHAGETVLICFNTCHRNPNAAVATHRRDRSHTNNFLCRWDQEEESGGAVRVCAVGRGLRGSFRGSSEKVVV